MRAVLWVSGLALLISLPAVPAQLPQVEPIEHDPILIASDQDFLDPRNGVTGLGTKEFPYVIQGWRIDLTATDPLRPRASAALDLRGTTKFVEIRDCVLVAPERYALYVFEAANVRLRDIEIQGSAWAFDVQELRIDRMTMTGDSDRVIIGNSSEVTISNSLGFEFMQVTHTRGFALTAAEFADTGEAGASFTAYESDLKLDNVSIGAIQTSVSNVTANDVRLAGRSTGPATAYFHGDHVAVTNSTFLGIYQTQLIGRVRISGNHFDQTGLVVVSDDLGAIVEGNVFSKLTGPGLDLRGAHARIQGNTFEGMGTPEWPALALRYDGNFVAENRFVGSKGVSIEVSSAQNTILDNQFEYCVEPTILIHGRPRDNNVGPDQGAVEWRRGLPSSPVTAVALALLAAAFVARPRTQNRP